MPGLVEPLLKTAVDTLDAAVDARSPARARNAAIEAARLSFDLQLRYRPATEIDLARMDLWAAQLLYVRDRIWTALDEADLVRVNTALGAIQVAVVDEEPAAAAEAAGRLRDVLAGLEP